MGKRMINELVKDLEWGNT